MKKDERRVGEGRVLVRSTTKTSLARSWPQIRAEREKVGTLFLRRVRAMAEAEASEPFAVQNSITISPPPPHTHTHA